MNLFLLLTAHLVGDYILQPHKLSEAKKDKITYLLLHTLLYTVTIFSVILLYGSFWEIVIVSIVVGVAHLIIDFLRIRIDKRLNAKNQFYSFIIDQVVHIVLLIILTLLISDLNSIGQELNRYLVSLDLEYTNDYLIKIFFCFVLILSPSSVFVKHLFNYIFDPEKEDICKSDHDNKAGAVIGILERLMILSLGFLELYTSIAIVFTAKSLARFKQMEDKTFAEKFLVGTLTSIMIAIICLIILKNK